MRDRESWEKAQREEVERKIKSGEWLVVGHRVVPRPVPRPAVEDDVRSLARRLDKIEARLAKLEN